MRTLSYRLALAVAGPLPLLVIYLSSSSLCPILCSPSRPLDIAQSLELDHLDLEHGNSLYHAGWLNWWHSRTNNNDFLRHETGSMDAAAKAWNILYHLGGSGPWVKKIDNVVEGGIALPSNCEIEQVHMLSRHGERYPTMSAGHNQRAAVERMKNSSNVFNGSLAFFNDWKLFWTNDSSLGELTNTGRFAGTLGSFTTGVRLRTRYGHLIPPTISYPIHQRTTFWASDSNRVIETAKYFALGFFGLGYEESNIATLKIISEQPSLGGDTLTPGRTCFNNKADIEEGKTKGYRLSGQYRTIYLESIRRRLKEQTSMDFSDQELYSMQEMCGFETTVRGRSDWCDVFTQDDFLKFEYSRDLMLYYRAGPGQRYAASMGWLWLNATTNLLLEGSKAGPLFFSFVHDSDVVTMLAALNVFNSSDHLPVTEIPPDRQWRMSQIVPMGGRVLFELLSCKDESSTSSSSPSSSSNKYVRLNINDGITAMPDCHSGPGSSCPLADFAARTKKRGNEIGDFRELCGLDQDAAEKITFLHQ